MRAWLHDRVLQSLEYLAAGGYADDPDARMLQRVAARAADELRAYVDGEAERAPGDLGAALDAVAADARMLAGEAHIRLVVGPEATDLPAAVVEALAAATREALANVAKHARASRAIVRAEVAAARRGRPHRGRRRRLRPRQDALRRRACATASRPAWPASAAPRRSGRRRAPAPA